MLLFPDPIELGNWAEKSFEELLARGLPFATQSILCRWCVEGK